MPDEIEHVQSSDGKRGCPTIEWDGPYSMRCGLGANARTGCPTLGRCAYHGLFEQPEVPPRDPERLA